MIENKSINGNQRHFKIIMLQNTHQQNKHQLFCCTDGKQISNYRVHLLAQKANESHVKAKHADKNAK